MNILPKKRWHVRTRENIARVRRDEAQAAEEKKKEELKVEVAEREARTQFLRNKGRVEYGNTGVKKEDPGEKGEESSFPENKHVNLFYELERNAVVSNKTNADHEKEEKEEREKYEKQIGYLTYLGQDTNELTGNVSWYNKVPDRKKGEEEVGMKDKTFSDPLKDIRHYLGSKGIEGITKKAKHEMAKVKKHEAKCSKRAKDKKHKHKKKKKEDRKGKHKKRRQSSSSSSSSLEESSGEPPPKRPSADLEKLRLERLKREKDERLRANTLIAKMTGEVIEPVLTPEEPVIVQKYNSQFNPHLANQNFRAD